MKTRKRIKPNLRATCQFENLHLRVYFCGHCGNVNPRKLNIRHQIAYAAKRRLMNRMEGMDLKVNTRRSK